ncbi:unnamed protein product, partial [Ectocarpus sp. 12 AP-2014]
EEQSKQGIRSSRRIVQSVCAHHGSVNGGGSVNDGGRWGCSSGLPKDGSQLPHVSTSVQHHLKHPTPVLHLCFYSNHSTITTHKNRHASCLFSPVPSFCATKIVLE